MGEAGAVGAAADDRVHRLDAEPSHGLDGRLRHHFDSRAWPPAGLAVAPDGRTVVTTGPKVATLINLAKGEEVAALRHTDTPKSLLFSPDGRLLAVAAGRKVWLWDVAGRQPLAATLPGARRGGRALWLPGANPAPKRPRVARAR